MDRFLLGQLIVCITLGLIALLLPVVRGGYGLLVVGIAAMCVAHRERTIGYVAAVAVVYGCLRGIESVARRSERVAAIRWRLAVSFIFIIVAGFTLLRLGGSESLIVGVAGEQVTLLMLDMWLVLRFITITWEVGAGRTRNPKARDYVTWVINPFTTAGPLLRFSDYLQQAESRGVPDGIHSVEGTPAVKSLALGLVQIAIGYGRRAFRGIASSVGVNYASPPTCPFPAEAEH